MAKKHPRNRPLIPTAQEMRELAANREISEMWRDHFGKKDIEKVLQGFYVVKFDFVNAFPGYCGELFLIQPDYLAEDAPAMRVIRDEKAAKHSEPSESFGKVPQSTEGEQKSRSKVLDENELEELRVRLRNEEIAGRLKDGYITTLEKQYEKLEQKNERMIEQLVGYSRTLGQLETQLRQLQAPKEKPVDPKRIHVVSESEPLVFDA